MEEKNIEDLKEYVDSKRVTKMIVSSIPVNVYKEFKDFAINMAGDNYSLALKILLDSYNYSLDKDMVYQIQEDIFELKKIVANMSNNYQDSNTEEDDDGIPTFGKRKE